jgi:serine/threonine protein kinase
MYAAPEQRVSGREVGAPADIWALGLILNELFTGRVPHGTDYVLIGKEHPEYAYLDLVVDQTMKQEAGARYESIGRLKAAIASHHAEFISIQKLSAFDATVIPEGEIDDPLAHDPPKLVRAAWDNGVLNLVLDRSVNQSWVSALHNMGSYSSVMGIPPQSFRFDGKEVFALVPPHSAQHVIDHFKEWLPRATQVLKFNLEQEAARKKREVEEQLKRERAAEEELLRINRSLKI